MLSKSDESCAAVVCNNVRTTQHQILIPNAKSNGQSPAKSPGGVGKAPLSFDGSVVRVNCAKRNDIAYPCSTRGTYESPTEPIRAVNAQVPVLVGQNRYVAKDERSTQGPC